MGRRRNHALPPVPFRGLAPHQTRPTQQSTNNAKTRTITSGPDESALVQSHVEVLRLLFALREASSRRRRRRRPRSLSPVLFSMPRFRLATGAVCCLAAAPVVQSVLYKRFSCSTSFAGLGPKIPGESWTEPPPPPLVYIPLRFCDTPPPRPPGSKIAKSGPVPAAGRRKGSTDR